MIQWLDTTRLCSLTFLSYLFPSALCTPNKNRGSCRCCCEACSISAKDRGVQRKISLQHEGRSSDSAVVNKCVLSQRKKLSRVEAAYVLSSGCSGTEGGSGKKSSIQIGNSQDSLEKTLCVGEALFLFFCVEKTSVVAFPESSIYIFYCILLGEYVCAERGV